MNTYEIIETEYLGIISSILKRNNEDGSTSWIPIDLANSDYQQYLKSLEESSN